MRRTLVALVGATATGKTAVGEHLAAHLRGAVICADARQVYRELEIGTGKPTPAERARFAHRLFDLHRLGERATAGRWARAAAATCEQCFADGLTPVLVGGSGLYLSALQLGLHPEPPRDPALRAELEREWTALGPGAMHAKLSSLDPAAASSLRANDRQRVLRALEVVTAGGHPLGWWREHTRVAPLAARWRTFELTCESDVLAERITRRTLAMWETGLLEETRALVAAGQATELRQLATIGYDEALGVIEGTLAKGEAVARMALRTRQLAKRQRTWFRHQMVAETLDAADPGPDGARLAEHIVSRLAR